VSGAGTQIDELRMPHVAAVRAHLNDFSEALRRAAVCMGWDGPGGPFAGVIPQGARVVVKPNFVLDENEGDGGMDPLITDPSLVRAAVEGALESGAGEVIVGDAPIQKCRFDRLLESTGLGAWAEALMRSDARFRGIRDFRRTTCDMIAGGIRVASENLRSEDEFVLFDTGSGSLLEPISTAPGRFRVAWYDDRPMARTHGPGRHQYLVAREILEAGVVINLPKLKTHRKAGVTCALKNLIGINGNKEYLPHHRLGGAGAGGDCYPGKSRIKSMLEYVADRQNRASSTLGNVFWYPFVVGLTRLARWGNDSLGIDGSWSGNDTIWRTCLDLNRILLYGTPGAKLAATVQRRVLHIADAVIAGQGEGPLSPDPLNMGLLLASRNAPAMDFAGALLLGFDPAKIPLVRESFGSFDWPIARFGSAEVRMRGDLGSGPAAEVVSASGAVPPGIRYPLGWRDAVQQSPRAALV
jgi:uncharacterized protein (DUF362 family)